MFNRSSTKFAFSDPLKVNNMLFMNSGRTYSGYKWLGAGQETGTLKLDDRLVDGTHNFAKGVGVLLKRGLKRLYKNRFISLMILFFTYNPK